MAPLATQSAGSVPVFRAKRPLPFPLNVYQSAIGRKWVMAASGIGLLGFVLVHMIGNLHLYEGPSQMHEYAEALRDLGGGLVPRTLLLWLLRIGLVAMFVVHLHSAYTLTRLSRRASGAAGRGAGASVADASNSGRDARGTGADASDAGRGDGRVGGAGIGENAAGSAVGGATGTGGAAGATVLVRGGVKHRSKRD